MLRTNDKMNVTKLFIYARMYDVTDLVKGTRKAVKDTNTVVKATNIQHPPLVGLQL